MRKNIKEWGIKKHPVQSVFDGPRKPLSGKMHTLLLLIK
jgi:hypothetical protein